MSDMYKFVKDMGSEELYETLMAVGEEKEAEKLAESLTSTGERAGSFGILDFLTDRPWRHTEHAFGFIEAKAGERHLEIVSPGQIESDAELKNQTITISLDRLYVADYPGGGVHKVLFDFQAENRMDDGTTQKVRFNQVCKVHEGQAAGVVNYPIFVDLNVGERGLVFNCTTVNVRNSDDDSFLEFLEGDVFKSGLKLLGGFQPALLPLSETMLGIAKSVASKRQNIPVQDFHLGLDFDTTPSGLRLKLGSYVAVQIPSNLKYNWDWTQWHFDASNGQITNKLNPTLKFDFNYIIFGIKKQ
ncbi:MAG: hypothetical protein ACI8ZM_002716 [Crocinitomix sp.]|jgi:hypothetical protein